MKNGATKSARPSEPGGRDLLTLQLSEPEFHTILAALRFYQEHSRGDPRNGSAWIDDIATNGGDIAALDDQSIDDLCLRLNTRDNA